MTRLFDPSIFDPRIFQVGEAGAVNNCTVETTQPPQWSEATANAVQVPAGPWAVGGFDVARVVRRALAARMRPLAARPVPINGCRVATQQPPQVATARTTQTQGMTLLTAQAAQQTQAECCVDRNSLIVLYDLIGDDELAFAMFGVAP